MLVSALIAEFLTLAFICVYHRIIPSSWLMIPIALAVVGWGFVMLFISIANLCCNNEDIYQNN